MFTGIACFSKDGYENRSRGNRISVLKDVFLKNALKSLIPKEIYWKIIHRHFICQWKKEINNTPHNNL
jgi:hypothetical protein